MSARPRPVTATIKPPSMAPPVGVREHCYSLSSGSSTASLVSILDHDSYESLGSDCEDSPAKTQVEKEGGKQTDKRRDVEDSQTSDFTKTSEQFLTTDTQTPTETEKQEPKLTSWEKWTIQKAKEVREKQAQENKVKQKQNEEEAKKKAEEAVKLKKAEEKYNEWLEKKTLETKLRQKSASRQRKTKEEIELEKKKEIEEKAQQKYQDWVNQKKTEQQERKKQEKEKKKLEEEKKKEREAKCNAAFDKWAKDAQQRPRSACSSYGYSQGKLTGYYDASALSPPSYCNPIPWQPIRVAVSKPKSQRKPSKPKYRWNPDKYL